MAALTRREALSLADRLAAAAAGAADADTAGTLHDLVADLVNHANGHRAPWAAPRKNAVMTAVRGLKTGDLVHVPGRTAVVESVALDGLSFTDTNGARHLAAGAELVPIAGAGPAVIAA